MKKLLAITTLTLFCVSSWAQEITFNAQVAKLSTQSDSSLLTRFVPLYSINKRLGIGDKVIIWPQDIEAKNKDYIGIKVELTYLGVDSLDNILFEQSTTKFAPASFQVSGRPSVVSEAGTSVAQSLVVYRNKAFEFEFGVKQGSEVLYNKIKLMVN